MSDLHSAMRAVYADLLRERERWARSTEPGAAIRAVAYQAAAAKVMRALDDNPPRTARYLEPPHDDLAGHGGMRVEDLGGLDYPKKAEATP